MRKILFITTRNPFSGRYSGDVIRAKKIIEYLRKKNLVDVVALSKKKEASNLKKNKRNIFFETPNIIQRMFLCILSLIKFEPMQFGLFCSNEMKKYIKKNANNYDLLFFHQIRSYQYMPNNFFGNTVLEMGDLYSSNYLQTFTNLNFFNIFKFIYLLESFLVKKIENKIFEKFDRIILFSRNEIIKINSKYKNKIFHINESIHNINKKYKYSSKNYKILFIGNLQYIPNIMACKNFVKNVLPKLIKIIPNIEFNVIGNIKPLDKFLLSFNQNLKILGPQKKLDTFIKETICGLANLEIATGVQGKVLTYMSYGLPVICSKKTSLNFKKNIVVYKSNHDLINKINDLKNNRLKSKKFSENSIRFIKKLKWSEISKNYSRVILFNK